jgi:hypothetical protein
VALQKQFSDREGGRIEGHRFAKKWVDDGKLKLEADLKLKGLNFC